MRWRGASLVAALSISFLSASPASARGFRKAASGIKKYVVINLLLAAADYESARAVQHPGGCMESNTLFSHYPSRARFYSEGLAIDAGPELLGWFLHRKHERFWQAPFGLVSAWHVEGLISNLHCNSVQR